MRVHGHYGDICMCVFCVHRRSKAREGAHHVLLSPRAGWLMKHSYHAASVIYQEDGKTAPSLARTPTAPSPSSHPQS